MGFLKGKLAIKIFKSYPRLRKKPYWGNHFWAKGYFVNTVGMDEDPGPAVCTLPGGRGEKEGAPAERERQRSGYDLFS